MSAICFLRRAERWSFSGDHLASSARNTDKSSGINAVKPLLTLGCVRVYVRVCGGGAVVPHDWAIEWIYPFWSLLSA